MMPQLNQRKFADALFGGAAGHPGNGQILSESIDIPVSVGILGKKGHSYGGAAGITIADLDLHAIQAVYCKAISSKYHDRAIGAVVILKVYNGIDCGMT